jgi:hypothetical protein
MTTLRFNGGGVSGAPRRNGRRLCPLRRLADDEAAQHDQRAGHDRGARDLKPFAEAID